MSRKIEILDALIDIFRNQGIGSDFTISQLAKKVDIGKSTIYEYFKTKDEILEGAMCRVVEQGVASIYNREIDSSLNFEQAFKEEIRHLFDLAINSRFLMNLMNPTFKKQLPRETHGQVRELVSGVREYYEKRFADIYQKGFIEGKIKMDNTIVNALLISSLVTGSIIRLINDPDNQLSDLDIDEYIDALFLASVKIAN